MINNGVVRSDDLEIRSPAMRLDYHGSVDLQGQVNARVEAELKPAVLQLSVDVDDGVVERRGGIRDRRIVQRASECAGVLSRRSADSAS